MNLVLFALLILIAAEKQRFELLPVLFIATGISFYLLLSRVNSGGEGLLFLMQVFSVGAFPSLPAFAALTAGVIWRVLRKEEALPPWMNAIEWIALIWIAGWPLSLQDVYLNYQMRGRFTNVYFVFAGLPLVWLIERKGWQPDFLPIRQLNFILMAAVFNSAFLEYRWNHHEDAFASEILSKPAGNYGVDELTIYHNRQDRPFIGNWVAPSMAVYLQTFHSDSIRVMLQNADSTLWTPFSPLRPKEWPDMSRYGIHYSEALKSSRLR